MYTCLAIHPRAARIHGVQHWSEQSNSQSNVQICFFFFIIMCMHKSVIENQVT